MQNNEDHRKPSSEDVARELSGPRRSSAIWASGDRPRIVELSLESIKTNPNQPRKRFDQTELEELASSIERVGLMQPIVVQKHEDDTYLLVAGERRFRAHEHLKRETIAAIITQGNPDELAVIENVQRVNLSPLEEAAAYKQLMEQYDYKQEDLGKIVHKDQSNISMTLRLNDLPEVIRKDESSHMVAKSILLEVARETDKKKQRELWRDIKRDIKAGAPLTVRAVRAKRETRKEGYEATTADKMVALSTSLSRQLQILTAEELSGNRAWQDALRPLKQRLDDLFASMAEHATSSEPTSEEQAA